jgi:hypothetical protein
VRTQAGTFTIGAASGVGIWDHILVRKFGGNDGDAWLNGVPVLGGIGGNPGGLQFFRLGVNRNSSRLFQMDLDDVRVFDSVESPLVLFATPEPATASLILVGLLCLAFARRRSSRARFA